MKLFLSSPEHILLRSDVHRYLTEHYSFPRRRALLSEAPGLSRERWKALAQLGWLGTEAPEAIGGSSGTIADTAVIFEEFGQFLVPEPLLACAVLPVHVLCEIGDVGQCARP